MRSQSKQFAQGKCRVYRSIFPRTKDFRWLSCGVPPVLIPNTEVKPTYTESTVLETAWEDRQLPDPKSGRSQDRQLLSYLSESLSKFHMSPRLIFHLPRQISLTLSANFTVIKRSLRFPFSDFIFAA